MLPHKGAYRKATKGATKLLPEERLHGQLGHQTQEQEGHQKPPGGALKTQEGVRLKNGAYNMMRP